MWSEPFGRRGAERHVTLYARVPYGLDRFHLAWIAAPRSPGRGSFGCRQHPARYWGAQCLQNSTRCTLWQLKRPENANRESDLSAQSVACIAEHILGPGQNNSGTKRWVAKPASHISSRTNQTRIRGLRSKADSQAQPFKEPGRVRKPRIKRNIGRPGHSFAAGAFSSIKQVLDRSTEGKTPSTSDASAADYEHTLCRMHFQQTRESLNNFYWPNEKRGSRRASKRQLGTLCTQPFSLSTDQHVWMFDAVAIVSRRSFCAERYADDRRSDSLSRLDGKLTESLSSTTAQTTFKSFNVTHVTILHCWWFLVKLVIYRKARPRQNKTNSPCPST